MNFKEKHVLKQIDKLKNKKDQIAICTPLLMDKDFWDVKPHAEYHVPGFANDVIGRIDLYYPSLKYAIEVNEKHHDANDDKKRSDKIESLLGCEIYHANLKGDETSHWDHLEHIRNEMKRRILEAKESNDWNDWKFFTEMQAKKDHPAMLFLNINNRMGKDKCFNPTDYSWQLDYEKLRKVTEVAVFWDNEIQQIYGVNNTSWIPMEGRYTFSGASMLDNPFLNSGTTHWNSHSDKQYGIGLGS